MSDLQLAIIITSGFQTTIIIIIGVIILTVIMMLNEKASHDLGNTMSSLKRMNRRNKLESERRVQKEFLDRLDKIQISLDK